MANYKTKTGKTQTAQHRVVEEGVNVETLTGAVTLTDRSANYQMLDPGGADRVVTLPAIKAYGNAVFCFGNAADASGEKLTIQDADSAEVVVLVRGESAQVACDGSSWVAFKAPALRADVNVETLADNKTLTVEDAQLQKLDPDGSARDISLPAEASSTGVAFRIVNAADGAENLVVKDDGASTIATLNQNEAAWFGCDGTSWVHLGIETIALT